MRDCTQKKSVICPKCKKTAVRSYCMNCKKPVITESEEDLQKWFRMESRSEDEDYFIEKRKRVAENNIYNKQDL